jgi:hypothetical protein
MGRCSGCRILTPTSTRAFGAWRCTVAIAFVFALALSACGVERTLDGAKLEADITAQLLPGYPGAIRSVSCPNSADPQPGQSLLCVATLGGQVIDVNVELGGTAEALTTTAAVDARFVAVNEVAALLGATFGDELGLVTSVDCGQPVMVLDVDQPVVCEAIDPSGVTRAFDVRVDDAGLITLDLR